MAEIHFTARPSEIARAYQAGATDANGQVPERAKSTGPGNPCRHCLCTIPEGADMLILAHRPFPALQPYAETGPIFLCAEACERHDHADLPAITEETSDYLVKGYTADDRILYGTGAIIPSAEIPARAREIFGIDNVAYVHVRSARNNCYQFRIDRG